MALDSKWAEKTAGNGSQAVERITGPVAIWRPERCTLIYSWRYGRIWMRVHNLWWHSVRYCVCSECAVRNSPLPLCNFSSALYVRVMSDDTIITTILSIPNHYTREILWIFCMNPPLLLHHTATNDSEFHNPHLLLMPTNQRHTHTNKHFNPFDTTLSTSSLLRCCYRSFHILTECFW